MHIASHAYTAQRENTSHFEGSKKELSLKTTTTHRTETIKKMLSESGPESVLASKGKYSHTRTFAAGRDQRAILAFSPENKRVDGFVMNKDQQLVPIKPYDLPKELQQILSSDAFEAFLNDVHARLIPLHNGDFRLDLHQGLKGGVYSADGNVNEIKRELKRLSKASWKGRHESRIIIKNNCNEPLILRNYEGFHGNFSEGCPQNAFSRQRENEREIYRIPSGAAGGIFYDSTLFSPFGAQGYISIEIRTNLGNFFVICAFMTNSGPRTKNSARIAIRSLDGEGNVERPDIDTNGEIVNKNQFFSKMTYHNEISGNKTISKPSTMFNVDCKFDNKQKAYFTFKFTQPTNPIIALNEGQGQVQLMENRVRQVEVRQNRMEEDLRRAAADNQIILQNMLQENQRVMQNMVNEMMRNSQRAMQDMINNMRREQANAQ